MLGLACPTVVNIVMVKVQGSHQPAVFRDKSTLREWRVPNQPCRLRWLCRIEAQILHGATESPAGDRLETGMMTGVEAGPSR